MLKREKKMTEPNPSDHRLSKLTLQGVGFAVHVAFRSLCGFALTERGGVALFVKLQKLKFTYLMHCFIPIIKIVMEEVNLLE